LEPTPDDFVSEMVAVFREVRRVLRADGTLWLNLGDSYGGDGGTGGAGKNALVTNTKKNVQSRPDTRQCGIKPKNLIGIPWRVAFALQNDGWYLRQDIIWHKPNPMPESVKDRCTKAHEYLFLLAKSERYFFDGEAIAEEQTTNGFGGFSNKQTQKTIVLDQKHKPSLVNAVNDGKRNRRSVWTVATKPFRDAHFATFPPELITPAVLAGCPAGGTILDPFGGAGTTGLVATGHGRNAILVELNPAYAELARKRIGMFASLEQP
jgi:DNA modification methylase